MERRNLYERLKNEQLQKLEIERKTYPKLVEDVEEILKRNDQLFKISYGDVMSMVTVFNVDRAGLRNFKLIEFFKFFDDE